MYSRHDFEARIIRPSCQTGQSQDGAWKGQLDNGEDPQRAHRWCLGSADVIACILMKEQLEAEGRLTWLVVNDHPALLTSQMSLAPDKMEVAVRSQSARGWAICRFAGD